MYGYIYKTTNLINGKIYIGQHKWNKENIDENYKGSGQALKNAIIKYGYDNFDCIIIDKADSYEELNEKEIFWIEKYNSTNPQIGYNVDKGGKAIYRDKRDLRVIQKMKETKSHQHVYNNGFENKFFNEGDLIPEGWTPGQRRLSKEEYNRRSIKYKQTRKGKFWFTNGVDDIYCLPENVPSGFKRGKTKGNKFSHVGMFAINNGKNQTYILIGSPIPEGWVKGGVARNKDINRNKFATAKGKIWINNGLVEKYIVSTENIPSNWNKGRLKKKQH